MKIHFWIKCFLFLMLFVFICSYIIGNSGYYEYQMLNRKSMTEEQIKRFEDDVKNGRDIDLKLYLYQDSSSIYSNRLTDTMSHTNLKLNSYLRKVITNFFNQLKKLIS